MPPSLFDDFPDVTQPPLSVVLFALIATGLTLIGLAVVMLGAVVAYVLTQHDARNGVSPAAGLLTVASLTVGTLGVLALKKSADALAASSSLD